MQLFVALGAGLLVIVFSFTALAVWRIGQVTSWRALAMTARATGSFAECVAFIRFSAQHSARVIPRKEESRRFPHYGADSRRVLAARSSE